MGTKKRKEKLLKYLAVWDEYNVLIRGYQFLNCDIFRCHSEREKKRKKMKKFVEKNVVRLCKTDGFLVKKKLTKEIISC